MDLHEMQMLPPDVGRAARDWAEQAHDLTSAAARAGRTDPAGFPIEVAPAAGDLLAAWQLLAGALAELARCRAGALDDTLADWLATDAAVARGIAGPPANPRWAS
jgi:hypothetical protein